MPKRAKLSTGRERAKTRRPGAVPSKTGPRSEPAPDPLADVRVKINALDRQLVDLLNQRAALVVEVGRHKRAAGLPVYAPHREAEVLDRALKLNAGPLPDKTLEAVYRELMSGSFALQQPLRIGYLGPAGSYSHLAAVRHFGGSVEFEDLRDIKGVFTEVERGHVNYGLVPIENSTGGGITETLDAFRDLRHHGHKNDVTICAEVQVEIHHALLTNAEPRDIRRIYSKPEVFQQCRVWLARQFPQAELVPAPSSSRAAEVVAQECEQALSVGRRVDSAAIGSELAGQLYGLKALFARIEDNPGNITRFVVLSRQRTQATGDDKTSIMFTTADKPGALVHVLQVFERARVNLTHIEKRPSGRRNWNYTFFIDAQGHATDPRLEKAISKAKAHCGELITLGSYPRSRRVL